MSAWIIGAHFGSAEVTQSIHDEKPPRSLVRAQSPACRIRCPAQAHPEFSRAIALPDRAFRNRKAVVRSRDRPAEWSLQIRHLRLLPPPLLPIPGERNC